MVLIDTHTHLYLEEFDDDRSIVVERAIMSGVSHLLLPNIDSASLEPMLNLAKDYNEVCLPMFGLHPGSVNKEYQIELENIFARLSVHRNSCCAIGEIGIDLYWDKTYIEEQKIAFREQIRIAKKLGYPLVIHNRNAFEEIYAILAEEKVSGLTGVFHCFSGSIETAERILGLGFKLGIGGVITFRNSKLPMVIQEVELQHIVLETDSPFLAPHPYRGGRNESSYIHEVCKKIAEIKGKLPEEIAQVTSENAKALFNLNSI